MKKHIRYFGLIVGLITLCGSSSLAQVHRFTPKFSTTISVEEAPNLLKQCSRSVPEKIKGYFELKNEDIEKLESDFKKVLDLKPEGCCYSGKIRGLNNHGYQYAGLVINNKKYIYINAFYIDSEEELERYKKDWKFRPVIICDGGEFYWGVLYDIENGTFSQLSMNGVS